VRTRDYVERGNRKAERGIADPGKRKCAIKMRIPIGKCASVRNEDASAIPRSALAGETAVGGAGGGGQGKGREEGEYPAFVRGACPVAPLRKEFPGEVPVHS